MKKLLISITLMLFCVSSYADEHSTTAKHLTMFYKMYVAYDLDSSVDRDASYRFITNYMTEEVRRKMGRITKSTYADPLIKAQDVNEVMYETIHATHLEDDWYMISYYWRINDPYTYTQIVLKACMKDDKVLITYLPYLLGEPLYGDDLIGYPERNDVSQISQESALEFLESFYDVYLSGYCTLSLDLLPTLDMLRSKFLSENALAQFKAAVDAYMFDYIPDYDLLILGFDFDAMWYNSVKIENIEGDRFQMSFKQDPFNPYIYLTVKKGEDGYYIDSISTKQ